jgi:hypothetical protein
VPSFLLFKNNVLETGLSPFSGKSIFLIWLVLISGHQNEHKMGYINQTQRELSAGVKTDTTELHIHEALRLWPCIV